MARSRLLKPEFHTSPQVAKCSHSARLAFIGTFNFCDDNGVHVASISRLRMEVFAHDECSDAEVREWVLELLHVGLITLYLVGDEAYWLVTGWGRHQKIDKPTYRHPLPDGQIRKLNEDERRQIVEQSSKELDELIRRIHSPNVLAESPSRITSPRGLDAKGKGREGKGVTPPSQEDDGQPPTSTTEYTGGGGQKITRRRFVAVGGGHA